MAKETIKTIAYRVERLTQRITRINDCLDRGVKKELEAEYLEEIKRREAELNYLALKLKAMQKDG